MFTRLFASLCDISYILFCDSTAFVLAEKKALYHQSLGNGCPLINVVTHLRPMINVDTVSALCGILFHIIDTATSNVL